MRVVIAQLNSTVGDILGNCAKIAAAINEAKERSAELVVFSEFIITGYPPEDLLLQSTFVEAAMAALYSLMPATEGIAAVMGLPRFVEGVGRGLANSAAVLSNGALLGFQDKTLFPTYDVFDESRYFSSPQEARRLWQLAGRRVGITICEDIWRAPPSEHAVPCYSRDPIEELAALAPELVINLSASPFNRGKSFLRNQVACHAAQALRCPLVLCNQVGGNDGLIFDGRSVFVDARGKVVGQAAAFHEEQIFIDTEELGGENGETTATAIESEELYNALVLGTRDYLHKLGFRRACLGLSGGIDSAVVACIASAALGRENVLGVAMPSRYSSAGSLLDAEQLSRALGIDYKEISIEGPFKSYLDLLEPLFAPRAPDVTEENMQARIRGMILMAFSNKFGYMVLSTGNKSELALGYATLYGDMCGGLAVIGDVLKGNVYRLAEWINRDGEIIPISTITKAPSAELRQDQYDSDTLPSYDVIDNVVTLYVEEGLTAERIAEAKGYELEVVKKIVGMIHRNEYKRRQGALALRVTPKAFTIGRRFPIVQHWVR